MRTGRCVSALHALHGMAIALVLGLSGATLRAEAADEAAPIAYPLKISADGRHLVDQKNRPFLMVGDSPQSLIGKLSVSDAAVFMRNRAGYGFNALWINLLCDDGTACRSDGTTFDGVAPFSKPEDLSTPNPVYFQRADDVIRLAAANGMVVLLDPAETIGWLKVLRANGPEKAREYGGFLGRRFRTFSNIIWMHGNDFQSWQNPDDEAVVRAVADGIRAAGGDQLQTIELNYLSSSSRDSATWASAIDLDAVYTYYPTYAELLKEYNRKPPMATFMVEANYEFEHNPDTDGGSLPNLRRQEYWTMLSGASGQLYGSAFTWSFPPGWQSNLDTPGVRQLAIMKHLFSSRRWYDLVPDQQHATVTAGYGTFSPRGSISTDTYVTAARTPDGTLFMAYLPSARTLTLDMARLKGTAVARWFDPTDGSFRTVDGSPFANAGSRRFAPPPRNSAGDDDWVLVLEASAASIGAD